MGNTVILDVRGLKCPLPVLRTAKALDAASVGAVIEVWCTDPMARLDIPHLVAGRGGTVEHYEAEGHLVFRIIKTAA
jgi:tRNA 2-thiouridine synthesizing protein A